MKKLLFVFLFLVQIAGAQYVARIDTGVVLPSSGFPNQSFISGGKIYIWSAGQWNEVYNQLDIMIPTSTLGGEASIDTTNLLLSKQNANANFTKNNDLRLSDARTPLTHSHAEGDVTNLTTDLGNKVSTSRTVNGHALTSDITVSKSDVGLGSVDNTSDALKPISTATQTALDSKQATLVSGTNIKTINSQSILGSGDLVVSGGSGNGYCLNIQAASQSTTTDAQTLYWGGMLVAPSTTANRWRVYIPKAGTIKAVYIYTYSTTAGTAEAWVMNVRKNNTTDTQIASVALATNDRVWSNSTLNITVALGDYIEIKEVCPTWATNPATVTRTGQVYIE